MIDLFLGRLRGLSTSGRISRLTLRSRTILRLEHLEDRTTPSTFSVTTVSDSGAGSLRQAILNANAHAGLDTISFSIAGNGVQTISPTSPLPNITSPVVLNGSSQPRYAGMPLIALNGSGVGSGNGLTFAAGSAGSTIKGLEIGGFQGSGIQLLSAGNVVQSCIIGLTADGSATEPNGLDGVTIGAFSGNKIGGTTTGTRDIISGNSRNGVFLNGGSGNVVEGDYIGLGFDGVTADGNSGAGIAVAGGVKQVLGGTIVRAGNLIADNFGDGIAIYGATATGNLVEGNTIGLNAAGTPAPNENGVDILDSAKSNTVIGNVVSGNTAAGVLVTDHGTSGNLIKANKIGTDATGNVVDSNVNGVSIANGATGNTITVNQISSNINGIELSDLGTDANVITGNLIGLNAAGTATLVNDTSLSPFAMITTGVLISSGASHNIIGGLTLAARNVLSGNTDGILIPDATASDNVIEGNYIGTNRAGTAAVSDDSDGVFDQGTSTLIGGTVPGARNLISGNNAGVELYDSTTTVEGNYIGTDFSGTIAIPNVGVGVIFLATGGGTIGGTTPAARNVISGNGTGIAIDEATGVAVLGNYIGTNAAGTTALPNTNAGISVENSSNVTVGGPLAVDRNVISGNALSGVEIENSSFNKIQGNYIGTNAAGTGNLGNGYEGVAITFESADNLIGGTGPGEGNIIAFSKGLDQTNGDGVLIGKNYYYHFQAGSNVLEAGNGNTVEGNSIFGNRSGLSINVTGTSNDSMGSPTLTTASSAAGVGTSVTGIFTGTAGDSIRLEFYVADTSVGAGQAKTFLQAITVQVPAVGTVNFSALLPVEEPGTSLVAIATDLTTGSTGDSSSPIKTTGQATSTNPPPKQPAQPPVTPKTIHIGQLP